MDLTLALALIAAAFFLGYTVRGLSSAHGLAPPATPDAGIETEVETGSPVETGVGAANESAGDSLQESGTGPGPENEAEAETTQNTGDEAP